MSPNPLHKILRGASYSSLPIVPVVSKRTFVIGDIHGVHDETAILLSHLIKEEGICEKDAIVFLGDYIDRGPSSRQVIELMLDFKAKFPHTHFLKGNHEDMLLDFLGLGGRLGDAFLYNGGLETFQSYGISVFATLDEMIHSIPKEHIDFFSKLETILELENFYCVHAGLNPKRSFERQRHEDVYWIREPFLYSEHTFRKTVVFGHTPHHEVFLHMPFKVGLDTGLVFGNKLSCMELSSGKVYQVRRGGKEVLVSNVDLREESN